MKKAISVRLDEAIRDVVDFPKEGIVFKDITPVLQNAELSKDLVKELASKVENVDAIVGVESRGFLFGFAMAMELGLPFILIRKKGKLPADVVGYKYALEYGEAEIEVHRDAIAPGARIHIHDDLLATGGTAEAAAKLVEQLGAEVDSFSFLVELEFLNGAECLKKHGKVDSIIRY